MNCFAFIPCSDEKPSHSRNHHQTGSCENGLQVMVFDNIADYYEYFNKKLSIEKLKKVICNLKYWKSKNIKALSPLNLFLRLVVC